MWSELAPKLVHWNGLHEGGNNLSGSIKAEVFLYHLSKYYSLEKELHFTELIKAIVYWLLLVSELVFVCSLRARTMINAVGLLNEVALCMNASVSVYLGLRRPHLVHEVKMLVAWYRTALGWHLPRRTLLIHRHKFKTAAYASSFRATHGGGSILTV